MAISDEKTPSQQPEGVGRVSPELQAVIRLLARWSARKKFGTVEISFQEGRITLVKKHESMKPCDLPS